MKREQIVELNREIQSTAEELLAAGPLSESRLLEAVRAARRPELDVDVVRRQVGAYFDFIKATEDPGAVADELASRRPQ